MKKLIAIAIAACLLLCGCQITITPATEPSTTAAPEATRAPTVETTEPTRKPTVVPSLPTEEKVTVYLLEELIICDSGHTEYTYDENYNIESYTVYTIENTLMYQVFFEQKDANGMAGYIRTQWPEGGGDDREVSYFADGKLKEELITGSNFSGYQYEYDEAGNMIQKREYYDGILETVTTYEYEGDTLIAAYGEDKEGKRIFDCRVENGRIVEKIQKDYDGSTYSYLYSYDENGNLTEESFFSGGETMPGSQYSYKAVEVDAHRAAYLLSQQRYLLPLP